ncbi:alanine racemase [Bacillus sp. EB106-08-02-XG196]|jgi:alanine racemase|uniref:alanine racemase n=1 Tax=Bacillus sp. EB106-08-02-XG196 TaxID=2737049 RepID=UPI0015C4A2D2|nr:alanine racemase [Bacillus sp. EB106-08-02-XG196]NWQ44510.1 alanine racemase [Bacillus sp. EB106-08-02-XG196]
MTEQGYFYRDTWAEVDLDYILSNVTSVKKLLPPKVEIIAVVKANAYGHGDLKVAESALKAGATYLAVAFMDEAIALRNKGVLAPILVLGATRPEDAALAVKFNITITVFRLEWVTAAQSYLPEDKVLPVHVKLDTGMGRIGIRTKEELAQVVETISRDGRLAIEGVFTHFATADEVDQTYLDKQLELFHDLLSVMKEQPKYIHCSNSAAALRFSKANFNAVRLGIAMYGLTPSPEIENELPFPLKEAFSLRSRLVHVKKLDKGDKVSYGATYEAEGEEWIGTIPIGYADGWIRRLQGQEVLVEGRRVPIVGRICMDQCMVKLPHEVPVGTTVTLIGRENGEFISVNEIAQKLETINYEVPCIISTRVPRLYKQGGKIVVLKNYLLHE